MFGIQELILIIIFMVLVSLPLVFWLWALIDILRNEFVGNNKIVWLLLVIFIPLVEAILYVLIGRKQKIVKNA